MRGELVRGVGEAIVLRVEVVTTVFMLPVYIRWHQPTDCLYLRMNVLVVRAPERLDKTLTVRPCSCAYAFSVSAS